MKNKNRDCITDMPVVVQALPTQTDSKSSTQDQIISRDAEKSQGHYYVQKKIQDPFYMNISPGLVKAFGELNWNHELETHRNSRTNYTTSERRHFVTGSFSLDFKKAGWAATVEFHYYLRNVQDLPADGQTPNERRVQFTTQRADYSI